MTKTTTKYRRLAQFMSLGAVVLLSGCSMSNFWLFDPKGPIAGAELYYMIVDVVIMAFIILPTALLLVWALWRYRASNGKGTYDPTWSHSSTIELIVWGIPLLAVGLLGYFSYKGVHQVDPFNPAIVASTPTKNADPLQVDVITTDWQWLFIYPKQHIASVDQLVVPAHTAVHFKLTSSTVTNSFFIPQLVGQIYVMPGMRTRQSMLVNEPGTYHGFSATLSGPGFSWMRFQTKAVSQEAFKKWVAQAQKAQPHLTYAAFDKLALPTIDTKHEPKYYSQVQAGLFDHVIKEVHSGKVFATPMAMTSHM